MFYGVIEDPALNYGENNIDKLSADEVIVIFVVSGEYEWYDKNVPNCLVSNYKKLMVLCHVSPVNAVGVDFL